MYNKDVEMSYEEICEFKNKMHDLYYLLTYGFNVSSNKLFLTMQELTGESMFSWRTFFNTALFMPVYFKESESYFASNKMFKFWESREKLISTFKTSELPEDYDIPKEFIKFTQEVKC
jgi:hypothetical protein